MRSFFAIVCGSLLLMSAIACIVANAKPHAPRAQSAVDNYLARYHRCTVVERGWPLRFSSQYPEGYVNPGEPLAWDVDPIHEERSMIAAIVNGIIVTLLAISGGTVLWASRPPQNQPLQWTGPAERSQ